MAHWARPSFVNRRCLPTSPCFTRRKGAGQELSLVPSRDGWFFQGQARGMRHEVTEAHRQKQRTILKLEDWSRSRSAKSMPEQQYICMKSELRLLKKYLSSLYVHVASYSALCTVFAPSFRRHSYITFLTFAISKPATILPATAAPRPSQSALWSRRHAAWPRSALQSRWSHIVLGPW